MATKLKPRQSTAETDVSVSTLVVNTVSDATEMSVAELPPLYDAIDPDALDALFFSRDTDGYVEFQYAGHTVTVSADRTMEVIPSD